jgi:hypothetical protein
MMKISPGQRERIADLIDGFVKVYPTIAGSSLVESVGGKVVHKINDVLTVMRRLNCIGAEKVAMQDFLAESVKEAVESIHNRRDHISESMIVCDDRNNPLSNEVQLVTVYLRTVKASSFLQFNLQAFPTTKQWEQSVIEPATTLTVSELYDTVENRFNRALANLNQIGH